MLRLSVAVVALLSLAACDAVEPELPSRGEFRGTLRGDLDRDLEGDATVSRFPGFEDRAITIVSLISLDRSAPGRSLGVMGEFDGVGEYTLGLDRLDAASVTYTDDFGSAGDIEDVWTAISGAIHVTRFDDDGLGGVVEAELVQIDSDTGEITARTDLEAEFQAVTLDLGRF